MLTPNNHEDDDPNIRESVISSAPDAELLDDAYDDALVGVVEREGMIPVALYDYEMLLAIQMDRKGVVMEVAEMQIAPLIMPGSEHSPCFTRTSEFLKLAKISEPQSPERVLQQLEIVAEISRLTTVDDEAGRSIRKLCIQLVMNINKQEVPV